MIALRARVVACLAVAACLSLPVPASALTQEQIDQCMNKNKDYAPDIVNAACTEAIRSGRWSGKQLAWAYSNRGIAYVHKGDKDRALTDFNEAIRLNPEYAFAVYE